MLTKGDYLCPFSEEDAKEIITLAVELGVRIHEIRKRDHERGVYGGPSLVFNGVLLEAGGFPQSNPLTKDQFIAKMKGEVHNIPRDVLVKTRNAGVVPGATVVFGSHSPFVVPPYEEWKEVHGGYAWVPSNGAPHHHCWMTFEGTPSKVVSPSPDERPIQVGDWVETMKDNVQCSTIKAGVPVRVLKVDGGTITVLSHMESNGLCREIEYLLDTGYYKRSTGVGPSSGKKQQPHEQVQRAQDKDGGRAEGRVAERPDAGRQGTTGSRHPGQRASQPPSRFRGAKGAVRFTL